MAARLRFLCNKENVLSCYMRGLEGKRGTHETHEKVRKSVCVCVCARAREREEHRTCPSPPSLTVHVWRATAGEQPRGNQMRSMFVTVKAIIPLTVVTVLPLSVCTHWRQRRWTGQPLPPLSSVCTLHNDGEARCLNDRDS